MANQGEYKCNYKPPQDYYERQCEAKCPYFVLRKLVHLLEDPMSKDYIDRQVELLHEFIAATPYAYWVRDIPFVIRLIEIVVERQAEVPAFRKPLEYLIATLSIPPMLVKSSEVLNCSRDIQELFTLLTYILILCDKQEYRNLAMHAIKCLLRRKAPVAQCCVSWETIMKGMEASELPYTIAVALQLKTGDYYKQLLDLTLTIAECSQEACVKMINENIIDTILMKTITKGEEIDTEELINIMVSDNPDCVYNIDDTCTLLWTLLNAYKNYKGNKKYKGPSQKPLWCLRHVFRIFAKYLSQREMRNNIMTLILYLLASFPEMNISSSGLQNDIVLLAVASELGTGGTWASEIRFKTDCLDYDFKNILLCAIIYCIDHNLIIAFKNKIIAGVLRMVTPEMSLKWDTTNLCIIGQAVLCVLYKLVPLLPDEFIEHNGPERLLVPLKTYVTQTLDTTVLEKLLIFMWKTLHTRSVLKEFRNLDALKIFEDVCNKLLDEGNFIKQIQSCFKLAFASMELLVRQTDTCSEESVALCLKYMRRHLNPLAKDIRPLPTTLMCVMDFLWELLICNFKNLKYFIATGGIYVTLDVIKASCFPLKIVGLGLVADILEEDITIPHLLTWRNRSTTFMRMILDIFHNETMKIKVPMSPGFVIADIDRPIMGEAQSVLAFSDKKDSNSSPSLLDVLASCRPKVYAILQLLERHKEIVDITNEKYKINYANLPVQKENITLVAQNFLPLKLGEVWNEIAIDFQNMNIEPMKLDNHIMKTLITRVQNWSGHIQKVQETLLDRENYANIKLESKYYHFLKETKLVESMDALHELSYVARTTESMFRLIAKLTQRQALEKSSARECTLAEYHSTFMYDINVTPVYNQKLKIESNKIIDPFEKPFDIVLVSPREEIVVIEEPQCENSLSTDSLI